MTDQNVAHRNDLHIDQDDDPLAELAKIISGEVTPVRQESAVAVAEVDAIDPQPSVGQQHDNITGHNPAAVEAGFTSQADDSRSPETERVTGYGQADEQLAPRIEDYRDASSQDLSPYQEPTSDLPEHAISLEDQLIAELDVSGDEPRNAYQAENYQTIDVSDFGHQAETNSVEQHFEAAEVFAQQTAHEVASARHEDISGVGEAQSADFVQEDELIERIENASSEINPRYDTAFAGQGEVVSDFQEMSIEASSDQDSTDLGDEPYGEFAVEDIELASDQRVNETELQPEPPLTVDASAPETSEIASSNDEIDLGSLASQFEDQFAKELNIQLDDQPTDAVEPSVEAASIASDPVLEANFTNEFSQILNDEPADDGTFAIRPVELDELDHGVDHDDQPEPAQRPQERRMGSGFRLAAGVLVLALVAGVGIVSWGAFNSNQASNGTDIPFIKADSEPAKVKPEEPGGAVIANQDNQVYDKVDGTENTDVTQDTLITADAKPVILTDKSDNRLQPNTNSDIERSNLGLAPKRVKTLVVKPDGTILSTAQQSDEATASAPTTQTETNTPAVQQPASGEETQVAAVSQATAQAPTETAITEGGVVAIDGAQTTGSLPLPQASPRRDNAIVNSIAPSQAPDTSAQAPTRIAVLPNQASRQAATPAVTSSKWKVQVSSQRSRDAAEASFNNIRRRFSSILDNRTASIEPADIEGKGTFYRVKVQALSKSDAARLCTRLKSAGGSCLVTR